MLTPNTAGMDRVNKTNLYINLSTLQLPEMNKVWVMASMPGVQQTATTYDWSLMNVKLIISCSVTSKYTIILFIYGVNFETSVVASMFRKSLPPNSIVLTYKISYQ